MIVKPIMKEACGKLNEVKFLISRHSLSKESVVLYWNKEL